MPSKIYSLRSKPKKEPVVVLHDIRKCPSSVAFNGRTFSIPPFNDIDVKKEEEETDYIENMSKGAWNVEESVFDDVKIEPMDDEFPNMQEKQMFFTPHDGMCSTKVWEFSVYLDNDEEVKLDDMDDEIEQNPTKDSGHVSSAEYVTKNYENLRSETQVNAQYDTNLNSDSALGSCYQINTQTDDEDLPSETQPNTLKNTNQNSDSALGSSLRINTQTDDEDRLTETEPNTLKNTNQNSDSALGSSLQIITKTDDEDRPSETQPNTLKSTNQNPLTKKNDSDENVSQESCASNKKKKKRIEIDFDSDLLNSLLAKETNNDNVVLEEISRINSLYAKKIPRHPLLDKGKVTTIQLRKNNVQYVAGKWTNHELGILFKNIKAAKSNYEIKKFKDFMRCKEKDLKVKKIEVYRELSTHLLRPVSAVRKKLVATYVTGEENPEIRNKYYTPEENEHLLTLVEKYKNDWKSISREMDRSIISCQCKYAFLKNDNELQEKRKAKGFTQQHQAFSPEEDKQLLDIVGKMKKQKKLTRDGKIPWVLVAEKLGTRDRRICQRRYTLLTKRDVVVKLSLAEKYALTIKVLRLFISQNIEELSDVDWEKVKVGVRFKDHWSMLRNLYQRFIDANVDRDLNTNQQRLDYLLANPSIRVIRTI